MNSFFWCQIISFKDDNYHILDFQCINLGRRLNSIVYSRPGVYILDENGVVLVQRIRFRNETELNPIVFDAHPYSIPKVTLIGNTTREVIFVCENGEIYYTGEKYVRDVRCTQSFSATKIKNVVTNNINKNINFICDGKVLSATRFDLILDKRLEFVTTIEFSNIVSISNLDGCVLLLLDNAELYCCSWFSIYRSSRLDDLFIHQNFTHLASSIDFIHQNLCISKEGLLFKYSNLGLQLVDIPEGFNIVDAISLSPFAIVILGANNKLGLVTTNKSNNKDKFFEIDLSDQLPNPIRNTKSARK